MRPVQAFRDRRVRLRTVRATAWEEKVRRADRGDFSGLNHPEFLRYADDALRRGQGNHAAILSECRNRKRIFR